MFRFGGHVIYAPAAAVGKRPEHVQTEKVWLRDSKALLRHRLGGGAGT